ncbi:MAG: MBL fold metallo-hydrolase [Flavobacteriales bacterium]|nr:MBL fold metallo-hydrolase [Flavobacteriales bacterium]MCW8912203.1 MBL fold metallo-hydrolase [Flavobacteriales bacterium]MCW8938880.1 MBL fold metallo-hydrolase [Flavobacteriales bacterium]MCW8939158.1 MBL fold metallo-hydrolase [Flavobacteriales bacterium]MCW8967050.1 MBL fold metallo-hydrolase [Flavobacteriales bacterium]
MEIEFKDVNQGDSIIIKWNQDDEPKIGLIDCHSDKNNPTLQHIAKNNIKEIEFIIISHPHFDHFSGIIDLFNFCENNDVIIKELSFTFDTAITYAYSDYSYSKANGLKEFFEYLTKQSKKRHQANQTIKKSSHLSSDTPSKSFSEFEMNFLRPLHHETMSIAKSLGKHLAKINKSKPDFNIYSTVIELQKDNKSILLTSDAPKKAFKSLINYYSTRKREFHLIQIPHHGSINNHELKFWQSIYKIADCPAMFSVGEEPKDKLPDIQVVDEINTEGFEIYSTNIVYGISEHLKLKSKVVKPLIMKVSSIVRSTSKKKILSLQYTKYTGDQKFNF